jgi:hypothetical protein
MFTDVLKILAESRVRVCTLEGTMNGHLEDVSEDAVVFRTDYSNVVVLNPKWIISVKQLVESVSCPSAPAAAEPADEAPAVPTAPAPG